MPDLTPSDPPVLELRDVWAGYGETTVLRGVDITVPRSSVVAVLGPNGAGKSTLLDVITGKTKPHSGRVVFQGVDQAPCEVTRLQEQAIARLGIGRKFQTPNVFKSLSVLENLSLSSKAKRGVFATLAAPFSRNGHCRVHEILETIGLAAKAYHPAGVLAHGEKQWLELGMVMAQDPELLLTLARKHTLIVIDHDMTFVRQIARKVTVLHEGHVLCEGTVGEVQRNPKVIEVYLGQDREADAEDRKVVRGVR